MLQYPSHPGGKELDTLQFVSVFLALIVVPLLWSHRCLGIVASLNLLPTLLLMQANMQLAFTVHSAY